MNLDNEELKATKNRQDMELSKEEQEAILELNRYIYGKQISKSDIADYLGIVFGTVSKLQKENEKQSKVIDEMAKKLNQHGFFCVEPVKAYDVNSELYLKSKTTEEIKQYFYRKVEEDVKN